MTGLPETTQLLAELVGFSTVSTDSKMDMITCLWNRLAEAGATVEIMADESGRKANLWARLGTDRPGGILLSGHTDVVPVTGQNWTSDPFTLRQDGERLYGRGGADARPGSPRECDCTWIHRRSLA